MLNGSSRNDAALENLIGGRESDRRRKMLDLVNRMHAHGAQLDLDLPQIAVIGNQSAGKSSLIESIAGISLPRSSGTCTRCPTECRLAATTKAWQCTVSLRFIVEEDGSPCNPVRNVFFGPVITDKDEVEDRLRRAQLAILHPNDSPEHYLDVDDLDNLADQQSGFSTNYISLQISGPDVPDLSFVDLPGIIASVQKGEQKRNIELVRNLVSDHIRKPSCIIMLTVSCETDFENQGAFELAREFDPDGQRTIGVLTKPDRIGEGDAPKWTPIIENTQQPLLHGWYAVKQRNTRELQEGLSREVAREQEAQFFSETVPWRNLLALKSRMGTPRLTVKLSEVLTSLITKRIPELQKEVNKMLDETEQALRDLPSPPSDDAVLEVHQLIRAFSRTVNEDIKGTCSADGLIQKIREDHRSFRRAVRATAPEFRPLSKNRDQMAESYLNPSFIPEEEHIDEHTGKVIYVDEVMDRADGSITRELPDNYSFQVSKEYINDFVRLWERPAKNLFADIERRLISHLNRSMSEFFRVHDTGGLNIAVQNAVTQLLAERKKQTVERLSWLLEIERDPFTLNDHYLSDKKKRWLDYYRLARRQTEHPTLMQLLTRAVGFSASPGATAPAAPSDYQMQSINNALAELKAAGIDCRAQDLPALLKPDQMDYALRIMAEVRAYYHVAYKRYADNVPLAIDRDYLRAFGKGIEDHLIMALGLSSPDARERAQLYLQEARDVVQQREELNKRLERVENARRELLELYR